MNACTIHTYGIKAAGGQMHNSLCRGLKNAHKLYFGALFWK